MEEFLKREAMTGKLISKKTGKSLLPPNKQTNWDGQHLAPLWTYLAEVGVQPGWEPVKCLAAFPASKDPKDVLELKNILNQTLHDNPNPSDYDDNPVDVDASPLDRLKENLAQRRALCIYDNELQSARHIYFENGYPQSDARLLVHSHAFLFFQDWKMDLWSKRFVRDHIRYLDEIMCAAATVVNALHEKAKLSHPTENEIGIFDSMHIRRGDFQYKDTRIDADQIYQNIKDIFDEKTTIYIATDEMSKDFFQPLKEHYNLFFLSDFIHLVPYLNTNQFGMLDQVIASTGRVFIGTFYSTFTGYIMRLRGTYSY